MQFGTLRQTVAETQDGGKTPKRKHRFCLQIIRLHKILYEDAKSKSNDGRISKISNFENQGGGRPSV